MSNESTIFDSYTPAQLREIYNEDEWPKDFKDWVHREIAYELLDNWLENADEEDYKERVRSIIEDMTYGYEDADGNEMLDFRPKGTI